MSCCTRLGYFEQNNEGREGDTLSTDGFLNMASSVKTFGRTLLRSSQVLVLCLAYYLCHPIIVSANILSVSNTVEIADLQQDATLSGICTLRAQSPLLHHAASLSLYIATHLLGIIHSPLGSVTWDSSSVPDGSYTLRVLTRDAREQIVHQHWIRITIDNHGTTLQVKSPSLIRPLSGIQYLSLSGFDRQYYPALWQVEIDGELVGEAYTDNSGTHENSVTIKFDTRRYPNGLHDLYIGMHSDYWQSGNQAKKQFYNYRGGFERVVQFSNGRSPMGIRASYLHLYLQPGKSVNLGCKREFTDGSLADCEMPILKSSDPNVVIARPTSSVQAIRQGFAYITVEDGADSTAAYVWVTSQPNVPHFSGDGQLLWKYERGKSLFLIAPFTLTPSELQKQPRLLSDVKAAGINAVSQGFYSNPRDLSMPFSKWKNAFDAAYLPGWRYVAANKLHVLATGDEVCRRIGGEAWWTLNWRFGRKAVQYALGVLSATKAAVGLDVVDEASMLWGPTPNPRVTIGAPGSFKSIECSRGTCTVSWENNPFNDGYRPGGSQFALVGSRYGRLDTPIGRTYTAENLSEKGFTFETSPAVDGNFSRQSDPSLEFLWWSGAIAGCPSSPCEPPVPNDALMTITSWLRSVQPRVPLSWPALSLSPPSVQGAWMGPDSPSDYASHYWTSYNERPAFGWSSGIHEETYWMSQQFYERQPFIRLDRPQLMEVTVSGAAYQKQNNDKPYFSASTDKLDQPGVDAPVIPAEMMTALTLGVAGERLYYFEDLPDQLKRSRSPRGSYFQTGINPLANDYAIQRRWRAMSYAGEFLATVGEPYILTDQLSSPALGRNIATAVRHGDRGTMLMMVNDNDWDRILTVDFRAYTHGGRNIRYIVGAEGIHGPLIVRGQGQKVHLFAGESAIYLFQKK